MFTELGSERADGSDLPVWARIHNRLSSEVVGAPCYPQLDAPEARVISALTPQPRELVVRKTTSGPLAGTSLVPTLRSLGVDTLVVCGVVTDVCVAGMAREMSDSDFLPFVASDACATLGQPAHDAALASLARTFAYVVETDDILLAIGAETR